MACRSNLMQVTDCLSCCTFACELYCSYCMHLVLMGEVANHQGPCGRRPCCCRSNPQTEGAPLAPGTNRGTRPHTCCLSAETASAETASGRQMHRRQTSLCLGTLLSKCDRRNKETASTAQEEQTQEDKEEPGCRQQFGGNLCIQKESCQTV